MSTRGRKPKPTALKRLQGNPGRRPLPENEPEPQALKSMPRAPSYLDVEGRKFWKEIGAELLEVGLITELDLSAFAACCVAYSRWRQAQKDLNGADLIYTTDTGFKRPNPVISIERNYFDEMLKMLCQFGLTPSSRVGLKVEPKKEEDALDKLLKFAK